LRRLALLLLTFAATCGGPPQPACPAGFIGDPSLPPEAQMVYTDGVSQQILDVSAGMAIPLVPPPQGGYVMYLAARVRNMDSCVEFRGTLRDPVTGDEVGFDARGSTLEMHDDGWGWPKAISNANLSNVNGCPDYSASDVQGRGYTLEMQVVDKSGRSITVSQPIVPTCMLTNAADQADCICTCSANYVLGKCTPSVDGGTTD
jgi:hypothetical protein